MEMRRHGWREVYVEDELVRGSAPDKVRGAFGQRSRWCKVLTLAQYIGYQPRWLTKTFDVASSSYCLTIHTSLLPKLIMSSVFFGTNNILTAWLFTPRHMLSGALQTNLSLHKQQDTWALVLFFENLKMLNKAKALYESIARLYLLHMALTAYWQRATQHCQCAKSYGKLPHCLRFSSSAVLPTAQRHTMLA